MERTFDEFERRMNRPRKRYEEHDDALDSDVKRGFIGVDMEAMGRDGS